MNYLYPIIAVILISLASILGIFFIFIKNENKLKKIILYLVSFSAATFLGEVIFHLLPEAVKGFGSFNIKLGLLVLFGFLTFFVIEKIIHWRHCHNVECDELDHKAIGSMNLIGDGFHNLIDGLIIGATFLVDVKLGIATAFSILMHEIPQEIGDFGVLIHSGFSKKKALLSNFLISLTSIFGTVIALIFGSNFENFLLYITPFTAGGFLYIATVDLFSEIKHEIKIKNFLLQFLVILCGIGTMLLFKFIEN